MEDEIFEACGMHGGDMRMGILCLLDHAFIWIVE